MHTETESIRRSIAKLSDRIDDLEILMSHIAASIYAPADPVVQKALGRIRVRGTQLLIHAREELSANASAAQLEGPQDQQQWNEMFAANTAARQARARLEALDNSGAGDDEIADAKREVEASKRNLDRITTELGLELSYTPEPEVEADDGYRVTSYGDDE